MSSNNRSEHTSNHGLSPGQVPTLLSQAQEALRHAIAPSSNFRVGAALLTQDQKIFTGCNIESPVYLGLCAERVALFKALSEGARGFLALAIAGEDSTPLLPCGTCRQLLWEFAPTISVIVQERNHTQSYLLKELLPSPFERNVRQHLKSQ